MRQLQMDQDYLKHPERMLVRDQDGKIQYIVSGRWGRVNDLVNLYDASGERLIQIRQKTLSLFPTFDIKDQHEKIGTVRKYPGLFGLRDAYFKVSPMNWKISGDFEAHHYQIRSKKEVLMTVQKVASFRGNLYHLVIYDESVEALCTALAVIIDHFVNSRRTAFGPETKKSYQYGLMNSIIIAPQELKKFNLSTAKRSLKKIISEQENPPG